MVVGPKATKLAGQVLLAGRYAVERELGRGSSGRVLLVLDTAAQDAPRAIKLVSREQEARLRWELGVLGNLAHPNLARVYELLRIEAPSPAFDLAPGSVALVTELAEGRAADVVAAELRRQPQQLLAATLVIADAVARALAALHARGLIHGDVKPANIVVRDDLAACKLIDLGLAAELAGASGVVGTPGYMAPELWRGERGPSADLYALGVTLDRLLRGAPVQQVLSKSAAEHVRAALAAPAAREALPEYVPAALRQLLAELLEPDPSARLKRAGEVSARIALIADECGVAFATRVGGGADDAPSPAEQAFALSALPFVGHAAALDALATGLARGGLCIVHGARGSGRTRLVREAVRRLQHARVAADQPAPTYQSVARLPEQAPAGDRVLHVEDGEPATLAVAAALLRSAAVDGQSLAIVIERVAPLAPETDAIQVALQPLSEGDLRRLLEQALPGVRIGAGHVREALAVSGGLSGLLCRGLAHVLARGADMSRATSLRGIAPMAREEPLSLPEPARALAELLAVAGGELGPAAARVAVESSAALAEAYQTLLSAGMASRSAERLCLRADLVSIWRDAVPRERLLALASRIPEADLDGRARAHVWLARGDNAQARAAFLAEITALRAQGRPEQAAFCAREALALLADDPAREPLRVGLADALRAQGAYAEAREVLARAASARALVLSAELARLSGDRDAARELATRAADAAGDDAGVQVAASALLARLCYDQGEIERAQQLAEAAAGRAAPAGAQLRACEVLALALLHQGERERAARVIGDAMHSAQRAKLREAEARITALFAQLARDEGDAASAARRYALAFELADAAGEQHAAAAFLHNVGIQHLDAGDPGPAIAALRESARRLARLGRDADLARVLYNLGHAAQQIGQDDVALGSARRAHEAALRAGDRTTAVYAHCLLCELRLKQGDRKAVVAMLAQPLELSALPQEALSIACARLSTLHTALGESALAESRAREAELAARAADSEAAAVEHAIARCQLELARGRSDDARRSAELAHGLAQRGGSFDARLRATLCAARAARAAGDGALALSRLAEVRSMLDQASRGLSPRERAQLRALDAYRAAFETVPHQAPLGEQPAHDSRWRALAGVAKRLTAERRLPRLREIVLDAAIELAGAERGYLVLKDRDGRPRVREARGIERHAIAADEQSLSRSIIARVIGSGRPLTTMDAASDVELSGAASVHALSMRSVLAVPLRIASEVAGAIYLEDRLRPFAFGELELSLACDLAELASIAFDSAHAWRAERRGARRLTVLRARLARTVETQALELESLKHASTGGRNHVSGIIGHSGAMERVLATVHKVARSSVPVLIVGESGTGKELVARAIHAQSTRKDAAFVSENCGAIPETLLESALFGHVRGAFTGADRRRLGLFEVADGGTLFLDEIGEMSPAMQARLLRVLQDGEVRPVGGESVRRVSVRVLCATHRDLEAMVAEGRFREDLYYRLAVMTLRLPPLRERAEDIPALVAHFILKHAEGPTPELDRRALSALSCHPWPGNVRQLENEIRRALVLADGVIGPEHLSASLVDPTQSATKDPLDLRAQVDQLERRLIRQALDAAAGNQTRAARILGVSRYGLQKMMRRLERGEGENWN